MWQKWTATSLQGKQEVIMEGTNDILSVIWELFLLDVMNTVFDISSALQVKIINVFSLSSLGAKHRGSKPEVVLLKITRKKKEALSSPAWLTSLHLVVFCSDNNLLIKHAQLLLSKYCGHYR